LTRSLIRSDRFRYPENPLARPGRCCLQDSITGPILSCCLQDRADAVFRRVSSALRDSGRLNRGSSSDSLSSTRMLNPPLTRTVRTDLPIFGISSKLLLVVLVASPLLTVQIAANYLQGLIPLILRCLEVLLTIAAAPFAHDRRCRTSTKLAALETDVEFLPRLRQWLQTLQLQSRGYHGHLNRR